MNLLVTATMIFSIFATIFSRGKILRKAPLVSLVLVTLVVMYFFGGLIWNQIRLEAGPGYLGFIYADESMLSDFKAAIGPVLLAICIPYLFSIVAFNGKGHENNASVQQTFVPNFLLNLIISITFLICILGEGSSILLREGYLSANGFPLLLRLSGITNLVGVGFLGLVFFFRRSRILSWEFFMLLAWFIILLGKGSRSALLPFLIVIVILFRSSISRRFKFVLIPPILVLFTYTTEVIYSTRERVHGILMLPSSFFLQLDSPVQTGSSLITSLSVLSASLFTTIVTVPLSIGTLNLQGVLANANPLISNISSFSYDSTSNGIERIFPYSWVPASSAGTLFGVVGSFGVFAIFLVMSSANMFCVSKSSWTISGVFFKLADICFFAQVFFFLEYSTRIWFRVFWSFWLCFTLGLLLCIVEKSIIRKFPTGQHEVNPSRRDQSSLRD
jgi:hypothetical protein